MYLVLCPFFSHTIAVCPTVTNEVEIANQTADRSQCMTHNINEIILYLLLLQLDRAHNDKTIFQVICILSMLYAV